MKTLTLLLTLLIFGSPTFAQINTSCVTSLPWSESCVNIDPPGPTQQLYYSFTSPSDNIFFSYIYLTNCQGIQTEYTLYDDQCNLIEVSPSGFFNLTPDTDYIIGFSIVCESGNIITICPSELISLPIELVSFGLQYNVLTDFTTFNWITGSESPNQVFHVMTSSDCLEWSEIGQIQGNGTRGDYTFKKRIGKEGVVYFRLDWSDGKSNVVAFEYPKREKLKAYNLLGQEL